MEYFDIVNQHGQPIGESLPKSEVHRLGRWHKDVHVWMTDGHGLVEQQRAADKDIMPSQWDISVAGHVSAGESALESAIRETLEETGQYYAAGRFVYIGSLAIEYAVPGWEQPHRTYGDHYVIHDPRLHLEDLVIEEGKATGFRMYPLEQLAVDLTAPEGRTRHAEQPLEIWQLGLSGMRRTIANN